MNTDTMTVDQLALACAGATVECDACIDGTPTKERPWARRWGYCPKCRGTGRVFALPDAVRERCPGDTAVIVEEEVCSMGERHSTIYEQDSHGNPNDNPLVRPCKCHGRGWVPATDLATLLKASLWFANRRRGYESIWGRIGFWQSADEGAYAAVFGDGPLSTQNPFPVDDDFSWGSTIEEALLRALAHALEAQGARLMDSAN